MGVTPKIPTIDLETATNGLYMLGQGLAVVAPELELSIEDAGKIASAALEVSKNYDVSIDGKTLAWCMFGFTLLAVFGTKIYAMQMRLKAERVTPRPPMHQPEPNVPSFVPEKSENPFDLPMQP